jgi:hypothetical protein
MVVDELRKIGFANMADYMKSTPEGDPSLDFSNLTRDQTAALGGERPRQQARDIQAARQASRLGQSRSPPRHLRPQAQAGRPGEGRH